MRLMVNPCGNSDAERHCKRLNIYITGGAIHAPDSHPTFKCTSGSHNLGSVFVSSRPHRRGKRDILRLLVDIWPRRWGKRMEIRCLDKPPRRTCKRQVDGGNPFKREAKKDGIHRSVDYVLRWRLDDGRRFWLSRHRSPARLARPDRQAVSMGRPPANRYFARSVLRSIDAERGLLLRARAPTHWPPGMTWCRKPTTWRERRAKAMRWHSQARCSRKRGFGGQGRCSSWPARAMP